MRLFLTSLLLLLFSVACVPSEEEPLTDYPNAHLLINASELNELMQATDVFLIDARPSLNDTLIPGATHFAAVRELTDTDHPVEFFMIGPELFEEKMQRLGLNPDSRVVIYDGGNALASARLFYALELHGFPDATVLNGGIAAWLEEGLPIVNEPVSHQPGVFSVDIQEARACSFEDIVRASTDPDVIIFDARSSDEYTGVDERSAQSGHIPGAVNLEWRMVLEQDGIPYFLPADSIQQKYSALGITPDKEVISHCHTNVRGSHAYFTLRLMGYDSVRAYEGSWSEYGNREGAPVSR